MSLISQLRRSPIFRSTFLGILFLEVLSFFGWLYPLYGNIVFCVIVLGTLLLSWRDLRFGVGIMVAELMIGSHGYLFSFQYQGLAVSIRIGLFLAVLTATAVSILREKKIAFFSSKFFVPALALAAAIVYAFIRGLARGNGFGNVFFDANGYVFFAMVLPIWQAIRKPEDWRMLMEFALAGLLASALKVFTLLYLFSHAIWWILPETYRWVRDTRIGELTQMTNQFFRIFFQSQLYACIALFILLALSLSLPGKLRDRFKTTSWRWGMALSVALLSSILVSLSRSFWMGIAAAGMTFLGLLISVFRRNDAIWPTMRDGAIVLASCLVFITGVVLFPIPPTSGGFSAGSLFSQRALTFSGEAGVGSRWQLLPVLWDEVNDHLLLGKGFGEEVTYYTQDPRLLATNPTGEYTTFTFEWGYLDLWLKFGLIALAAYAWFIARIISRGVKALWQGRTNPDMQTLLTMGFLLGGISMLVTHTFSPYLHHPLGIAYILFWALQTERPAFSSLTIR